MRLAITGILAAALIAGCTQPAMTFLTAPEPPVVWPPAPDAPRVRYVGSLTGSEDIGMQKPFGQVMDELLYGPKPPDRFVSPHAIAVDATGNRVAVADVSGKCVHLFDIAARTYQNLTRVAWPEPTGTTPPEWRSASQDRTEHTVVGSPLDTPVAVCWAGDKLWVADSKVGGLAVFDADGRGIWHGLGKMQRPAGVAYCTANQLCYVTDSLAHRVVVFDRQGSIVSQFGSRGGGPGQFNVPSHVDCAGERLVVADSLNFRVQVLGLDGSPIHVFGRKGDAAGDFGLPKGVAFDADGNLWVVDAHFENVQAFTQQGVLLMAFGREGHDPGEFWLPAGICIDRDDRMWICDRENSRVQIFAILQPTSAPIVQ